MKFGGSFTKKKKSFEDQFVTINPHTNKMLANRLHAMVIYSQCVHFAESIITKSNPVSLNIPYSINTFFQFPCILRIVLTQPQFYRKYLESLDKN